MTDTITAYMDSIKQPWQVEICLQLHQTIQRAIPDTQERIQYGKPHYLKHGKYAAVFGTAKGWVSFTIFNATALKPPVGLFEASSNGDRITIKIKDGQDVDYALLGDLLKQAAEML